MHIRSKPQLATLALAGAGLLASAASAAAQQGGYYPPVFVPATPYPVALSYPAMPVAPQVGYATMAPGGQVAAPALLQEPAKEDKATHHQVCWPFHKKCAPSCPETEHAPAPKEKEPAKLPEKEQPKVEAPAPAPAQPTFQPEQAAAGAGEGFALDSGVGYIDPAQIRTMFRLRYDSAYGANRPDRAEFLYPKCGGFRINGQDPNAKGPPPGAFASSNVPVPADGDVDYQEVSAYFEYAFAQRFSAFIEVPVRFVNFSVFPQEEGFGDMNAGIKTALINSQDQVLTFQFRTYASTGMGDRGLGTQHVSLEPALLFFQKLGDRFTLEGEFRYWIPIGGSDYAGDVVRYGLGFSYLLNDNRNFRIRPVVEFVGWTVLNGKETDPNAGGGGGGLLGGTVDASGDTIVNGKFGVRVGRGQSDFYVGYGHALTGDIWYRDIIRVEFRRAF